MIQLVWQPLKSDDKPRDLKEIAEELRAAQAKAKGSIAATEANTRWQRDMRRFFVSVDGQAPAGDLVLLEPIFNLDDQLVAQSEKAGSETNGS